MDRQSAIVGKGNTIIIAAGKNDTGGSFALLDYELAPGFASLPLHIHHREDEAAYILEGRLLVRVGETERLSGPGEFIFMPKGIAHTLSNPGTEPARFLTLLLPAGFEQCYHDLDAMLTDGAPFSSATLSPLLARYGVQIVVGTSVKQHVSRLGLSKTLPT